MPEDAVKQESSEKSENAVAVESATSSSRFIDELFRDSAKSGAEILSESLRPSSRPTDCFPIPGHFPPDGQIDIPPIGQTKPGENPRIYIPSPSNIAPIELPGFFEKYPKSPELDRVGEAADRLAQLMKDNASPEEQKKAWDEFEKNAKDVPGNLAALRLELSLFEGKVPGGLGVQVSYDGKLSLIDYGQYESQGKFPYNASESARLDFEAEKKPEVVKATSEFAEQMQKGVSSEELKQMLPELLDKLAKEGLDASAATSAIYHALTHVPDGKYGAYGDREPSFMVDGKPVRLWINALIFDKNVTLGFYPQSRKIFG